MPTTKHRLPSTPSAALAMGGRVDTDRTDPQEYLTEDGFEWETEDGQAVYVTEG